MLDSNFTPHRKLSNPFNHKQSLFLPNKRKGQVFKWLMAVLAAITFLMTSLCIDHSNLLNMVGAAEKKGKD